MFNQSKKTISIPEIAAKHFNTESEEILKSVGLISDPGDQAVAKTENSIKHKIPIFRFDNISEMKLSNRYGPYAIKKNGKTIGFVTNEAQQVFLTMVRKLIKRKELNAFCSERLILDTSFDWFIKKHQLLIDADFSVYLMEELNNSCKDFLFFFPVLYLEIETKFNIGNVTIDFFTERTIEGFKNSNLIREEDYESIKKEYSGQVNASIAVGPRDHAKAEAIARQACTFALDVLRLFSPTVYNPDIRCDFGLESGVKFHPSSNPISIELKDEDDNKMTASNLSFLMRTHTVPLTITNVYFQEMLEKGFGAISNFIARPMDNEIGELIIQSISFYADAISHRNQHKRIVELFTIIESFLVRTENEPIQSSIGKYFPKIVCKDPKDRTDLKEILTKLYGVRSGLIHHGKHNAFEIGELAVFQEAIRIFIINMIEIGSRHETKHSFLSEIDNAINAAY